MLIESEARRPELDPAGCIPIELADGQSWYFPRPALHLVPTGRDGRLESTTSLGPDFDDAIASLIALEEEPRPAEETPETVANHERRFVEGQFHLAATMLERNYAIPEDGWRQLLRHTWGDAKLGAMWSSIFDVAMGRDPRGKASPATSGPPS